MKDRSYNVISRKQKASALIVVVLILLLSSCADNNYDSNLYTNDKKENNESVLRNAENSVAEEETADISGNTIDYKDEKEPPNLTDTIPYVGMAEKNIDETACGKHTDTGQFSGNLGYRWSFDDLHALVVYVKDGKVTYVNRINEDLFWDGDMPHLEKEGDKMVWKPIPGALHKRWEEHEKRRDKDVDNFATAEEYADYYRDDYLEVFWLEHGEEFNYDESLMIEQSYFDAMDHWEKNQPLPEPEE